MPRHRIKINILDTRGRRRPVLKSHALRLPNRLLRLLFGDFSEVLVLSPGKTVDIVEIHEIKEVDHEAV